MANGTIDPACVVRNLENEKRQCHCFARKQNLVNANLER